MILRNASFTKKGIVIGFATGLLSLIVIIAGNSLIIPIHKNFQNLPAEEKIGDVGPCDYYPIECSRNITIEKVKGMVMFPGLVLFPILAVVLYVITLGDHEFALGSLLLSFYLAPLAYILIGFLIGKLIDIVVKRKKLKQTTDGISINRL